MYQLRVPSGAFSIAALAASVEAGFLGSVLLLCRRLDPKLERELRESWADLDDLTHNDILVLVTGLRTKAGESIVVSDRRKRHIYADGVRLKGWHEGFASRFDELLKFAEPIPDLADDEATGARLIDPEGVTEIRRDLNIAEQDLPVLLVRSHNEDKEILIRLASSKGVFSPTRLISEIVIHIGDTHRKIADLKIRIQELDNAAFALSYCSRQLSQAEQQFRKVSRKLEGRVSAHASNQARMRRALDQAPESLKQSGELVLGYLQDGTGCFEEVIGAMEKIAEYVHREGGENRFALHFKTSIDHRRNKPPGTAQSKEQMEKARQSYLQKIEPLKAEYTERNGQKSAEQLARELSAARKDLSDLEELRVCGVLDAVKIALVRLGFQPVEEIGNAANAGHGRLSSRQTYTREGNASLAKATRGEYDIQQFDVFLSHNSHDKPVVRQVAERLRLQGLHVWYDEWELIPGRPWQRLLQAGIRSSRSVAVLFGGDGLGPWSEEEMEAALILAVRNGKPVIPVLLPGAPIQPEMSIFLETRTWIDLRAGLTDEALGKLMWGITGKKERAD